jgi:hypothetical protein
MSADLQELIRLKARGLSFGDCLRAFGVDRGSDPYARTVFQKHHRDGEIEIDSRTVVSLSDDGGAYVMAWLWVSNAAAGLPGDPEDVAEDGGAA